MKITSLQNSVVKQIVSLQEKSKLRKQNGVFIVEGLREISLAKQSGYHFQKILFQPEIISKEKIISVLGEQSLYEVSQQVYQKIAYRGSTEGVLAIAQVKNHQLESIGFQSENPLVLVAEAPEKPGNIGALLRTADAAGVDAVLIANLKTDLYNPNIIRSSVGCVFSTQIATASSSEIISFLKERNFQIFCAALSASVGYHTADFTQASAIVVGTEDTGLSDEWLSNSTQNIIIPMSGKIDSMNVSVAAAIITFEAKRQRNFSK